MRRRARRIAIFAAVVAAHLLALHFFPDFHGPPEPVDQELTLPIAIFPVSSRERLPSSRHPRKLRNKREERIAPTMIGPREPRSARPWVDWEKEADGAIDNSAEHASEAARRASALSRWREHVMPGPSPRAPEFRWDYAATHRIVVTPGRGMVFNINDRCFIVATALMVLPVCRIGQIPAYGDLFAHMDDPKEPGESSVPWNPR